MKQTVVLDNEAVQALLTASHPKHRKVLAHMQVVAMRKSKAASIITVAPTAVRVEAGCDRSAPTANLFNNLRIVDAALGTIEANSAVRIRAETGVSVADSHVGATIRSMASEGRVTVISSDPDDMVAVAGSVQVTMVAL